jgi:hypothetical protein
MTTILRMTDRRRVQETRLADYTAGAPETDSARSCRTTSATPITYSTAAMALTTTNPPRHCQHRRQRGARDRADSVDTPCPRHQPGMTPRNKGHAHRHEHSERESDGELCQHRDRDPGQQVQVQEGVEYRAEPGGIKSDQCDDQRRQSRKHLQWPIGKARGQEAAETGEQQKRKDRHRQRVGR